MKTGPWGRIVGALLVAGALVSQARVAGASDQAAPIAGWPARGPMLGMACPGINVCFAVGSLPVPAKPTPQPSGGVIAHTDDSGASWAVRTDPHSVFGGIFCPSPTQCYVPTAHIKVRMVDAHHGISKTKSTMSVTEDGGKTWQERALPSGVARNAAMACPAVNRCVLWGEAADPASHQAVTLITTDAGRSWKTSRIVTPGQPTGADLECPTIRICYLYGGFSGTSISVSQDGGMTWRALPRSDMFALSGVPSRALAHMGGLACPSAQVCYTAQGDARCQCDAWGPYGTIFGTQDGGKHWSRLYRAPGRDYPEGVIDCPSVSVCYAVGSAQRDALTDQLILSTKDGGRTWTTHRLPVVSLTCAGVDVCYAFSYAGVVYRTSDGGSTWQALH